MKFSPLPIAGAWLIEIDPQADARGHFARLWCRDEFAAHGIVMEVVQASVSHNRRAGTLRGLHWQRAPSLEAKLVRCQRGRVHDVIVDVRPGSPSYLQHAALVLDSAAHNAAYVPPGCAHGFQTLEDDCEVVYLMSDVYRPDLATGVRHDDPAFGIAWPLPVSTIADRDRAYPDFDPARGPKEQQP
jgi:dTDP-4-dehydrorhamnose 3,5-epimerase